MEHVTISDPTQNDLITDHSSIVFNLKTSVKPSPSLDRTIFDYRRGDFDGLRSALQSIDLCSIIQSEGDINLNWLQWKDTFLAAVADFIPTKRIKGRNTPPWINGEIIHAIRKKETVRQKLKRSPTKSLNDKFKELTKSRVWSAKVVQISLTPLIQQLGFIRNDFGQFLNLKIRRLPSPSV